MNGTTTYGWIITVDGTNLAHAFPSRIFPRSTVAHLMRDARRYGTGIRVFAMRHPNVDHPANYVGGHELQVWGR